MYSNVFNDVIITDRRMKKHFDDILTAQELVDLERMSQTWDDISDKEKETIIRHDLPFPGRPTQRQIDQMAERETQMAAYLATNPDSITGLPTRQAQEQQRPGQERDRPMSSRYDQPREYYYYDYYGYRGSHGY